MTASRSSSQSGSQGMRSQVRTPPNPNTAVQDQRQQDQGMSSQQPPTSSQPGLVSPLASPYSQAQNAHDMLPPQRSVEPNGLMTEEEFQQFIDLTRTTETSDASFYGHDANLPVSVPWNPDEALPNTAIPIANMLSSDNADPGSLESTSHSNHDIDMWMQDYEDNRSEQEALYNELFGQ